MQLVQIAALLLLAPVDAFQAGVRPLASAPATRSSAVSMGEPSTSKWNEWKYVKSINDYGKEQTYMYLGPKDNAEDGSSPLSAPLINLGAWSFLTKP